MFGSIEGFQFLTMQEESVSNSLQVCGLAFSKYPPGFSELDGAWLVDVLTNKKDN